MKFFYDLWFRLKNNFKDKDMSKVFPTSLLKKRQKICCHLARINQKTVLSDGCKCAMQLSASLCESWTLTTIF